jgi:GntR family transcriptional repressor for pyruvate dehydrogenase complex
LEPISETVVFRTVSRTSVVSSVREQMLALLEERALRPGDRLPSEREMMVALGVGRSSVREALSALVAVGVLTAATGQGYRVRSLTAPLPIVPSSLHRAQVAELFEARLVLEAGIAELACARATEEDFAALEGCLESIERARRARRSTAPAAARFHALMARAARNGFLEEQILGLRKLMVEVGLETEGRKESCFADEQWAEHKLLLDTLRTRDADTMRAVVRAHITRFAVEAGVPAKSHPDG